MKRYEFFNIYHLPSTIYHLSAIILVLFLWIPGYSQTCPMSGPGSTAGNCECDLPSTPVKKVRIMIHVFLDDNGQNNIPDNASGNAFLDGIVDDCNVWMRNLVPYDKNPTASVTDSRIEFDLVAKHWWPNSAMHGKSTISTTFVNDLYNYVDSKNVNHFSNSIHIFIPGDDNTSTKPHNGIACGIPCKKWSTLTNVYWKYLHPDTPQSGYARWAVAGTLRHEIGHNLSLRHTDITNDGCDDTPGAQSNNLMNHKHENRNSLTDCQAGRMHHYLNNSGSNLVVATAESPNLTGTISGSGYYGPLQCCTQNVNSSNVTVNIAAPGATDIIWTKLSGSGTLSSNASGTVLTIGNLGSINMKVTWTKNCINYNKTYTLYNGGYYFMAGPNPVLTDYEVEIMQIDEWRILTDISANDDIVDSWTLFDESGNIIRKRKKLGNSSKLKIPTNGLKPGSYSLILQKGDIIIDKKLVKI